jgi:hypothetical protein
MDTKKESITIAEVLWAFKCIGESEKGRAA